MRKRHGFTLIEIMIVVVIIAILAAIAIPKYSVIKQQAYLATVIHDLKNLEIAQEAYASSNPGQYFSHTYNTPGDSANAFGPAQYVSITVTASGQTGWSATAANSHASGHTCAVFVGVLPISPAVAEGVPNCN